MQVIKENQPYKLYYIYFDPRFLEELSNIHQQLKKEGLFFEFPRYIRILAVSFPSAPIIIDPLLLIFSNFPSGLIITLFMIQTGWFLVFAMTISNDFLDYKATVRNLNKDMMRDLSGNPFSPEELQVIMQGIPETDWDLKRLVDVHSKRRRIELKPQIYP
ncbi:MAG: hypothetical protein D6732_18735 [Methanobacteriota archaeon]|nr:MAG: hypothetical protein D6732_18735 [Euryarchaeota archaeon]